MALFGGKSQVIGVAVKPSEPRALELATRLLVWLTERSMQVRLESAAAEQMQISERAGSISFVPRERLTNECDIIVVLGGDGTLISVSRHPSSKKPRIIGVNMGTLGFLTEITVEEVFIALDQAICDEALVQPRPLLKASVIRDGGELEKYYAINDVVLTKEAIARIFGIDFYIDNNFAARVRGDGVIVSTPGGSTAYSLAAGGSIVHPGVQAYLVTPICPHALTSRPLVLPGSSTVRLVVRPESPEELVEVHLTVDGQEGIKLRGGDEIVITTSEFAAYFVRSPSRSYFDILAAKLMWARS